MNGARSIALGLATGAIAGAIAATPGCLACTGDLCGSRLVIMVREPGNAALAPGLWDFEIVADGEPLVGACEIGEDSRSVDCEPADLTINPMIFDDPDNPFTAYQIPFEGGDGLAGLPTEVQITILHDGDIVFSRAFEPDYELTKPERCDPDCFDASIDAVVERE
jgi:hypothetical protein